MFVDFRNFYRDNMEIMEVWIPDEYQDTDKTDMLNVVESSRF